MGNLRNLTVVGSIFFMLAGCAGNQSFSELNKTVLSTSDSLLQVSQSIRGAQDDSSASTSKSSNKKSSKIFTNKKTRKSATLSSRLFNECMESKRTKLRFDMGKSVEQIEAEKAREEAYNNKYCTCTLPYEEEAASKLYALGYDGTDKSINKMQKNPAKSKKINEIIIQLSLDKSENCSKL